MGLYSIDYTNEMARGRQDHGPVRAMSIRLEVYFLDVGIRHQGAVHQSLTDVFMSEPVPDTENIDSL
jgi:hypothetical protein